MNKFKRLVSLFLSLIILGVFFVGCNGQNSNEADAPRVALILEGPISDMAWNAAAYKGLTEIEKLGAEIGYEENVSVNMVSDVIETYVSKGYNIIYLATNGYYDSINSVISNYPNVQFVLMNGDETKNNLYSTQIAEEEQGFMMGVIAATATKTKKVGFVGGPDILPIVKAKKGFVEGVKYVDDSVEVFSKNLDCFKNINQAREFSKQFIKTGVDVLVPVCDQSAIGVIEAAEEANIMSVCSGAEQEAMAVRSGLIAVEKDSSIGYVSSYKKILDGTLEDKVTKIGVEDGAIYLSNWFAASDSMSEEEKQNVEDIYNKLKNGEISINLD